MKCEDLRDDYDAFALGEIELAEPDGVVSHLRRRCPVCSARVGESLNLVSQLGLTAKQVDPPARLRRRILATVDPTLYEVPRTSGRLGWSMVWAAAALILLTTSVLLGMQAQRIGRLRRSENARLANALSLMTSSGSTNVSFGANKNQPPRGRVFLNQKRGVLLLASNLPQLATGRTFELWLIPHGAKPVPAGLFRSEPNGTGLALELTTLPPNLETVAVTVEADEGAAAPTTAPIIAASAQSPGE